MSHQSNIDDNNNLSNSCNVNLQVNARNNVSNNTSNISFSNLSGAPSNPPPAPFSTGRVSYAQAASVQNPSSLPQVNPFNLARPNTLELFVPNNLRRTIKNLSRADYVNSVFRSLGTDAKRHVKCIQMGPTGYSCRVTFKEGASRPKEALLAKGIHMRNNFLFFQEAQRSSFVINISNLPCELPDATVADLFSTYGLVKRSIRIKDLDGLETGDRRLIMDLRYHVPARLPVGNFTASIWYQGRPTCCSSCNWWGHKIQDCPLNGRCAYCGGLGHKSFACTKGSLLIPYNLPANEQPDLSLVHPLVFSLGLDDDDVSSQQTNDDNFYENFQADLREIDDDVPPEGAGGDASDNPPSASAASADDSGNLPPMEVSGPESGLTAEESHHPPLVPYPSSTTSSSAPPASPTVLSDAVSSMDTPDDDRPLPLSWADSAPPPDVTPAASEVTDPRSPSQTQILFPDTPMETGPASFSTQAEPSQTPILFPDTQMETGPASTSSQVEPPESPPGPSVISPVHTSVGPPQEGKSATLQEPKEAALPAGPSVSVAQKLLSMSLFTGPRPSNEGPGPTLPKDTSPSPPEAPPGGVIPSSNPGADASPSQDPSTESFSSFSTPSFCAQLDPGRRSRRSKASQCANSFAPTRTHSRSPVTAGRKRV